MRKRAHGEEKNEVPKEMIDEFALRMRDAERKSGVSVRTLYEKIASGELQSTTVGRRRLVLADSLKQLVMKNASKPMRPSPWIPKEVEAPMDPAQSWEEKGRGKQRRSSSVSRLAREPRLPAATARSDEA